jgi:hypothetical protein
MAPEVFALEALPFVVMKNEFPKIRKSIPNGCVGLHGFVFHLITSLWIGPIQRQLRVPYCTRCKKKRTVAYTSRN